MAKKNGNQKTTDSGSRTYLTPIGELPSVTTINALLDDGKSGALMGWATKIMAQYLAGMANAQGHILITKDEVFEVFKKAKAQHKIEKEKAADIGSGVHNLLEVFLMGQPVDGLLEADNRLVNPFNAFKEWQSKQSFELVASERQIYSPLRFAGTLDCLAKLSGKLYLIDFKSSSGIYGDSYFLQLAAYAEAVERGFYFDNTTQAWQPSSYIIDGVGVLRLDKETGLPEWREVEMVDCWRYFKMFMNLCNYWWLRKK